MQLLMRVAIAVVDSGQEDTILELLTRVAIVDDYEMDVALYKRDFGSLLKTFINIDIAFLGYGFLSENIRQIKDLYKANPHCLIVLVGSPDKDVCNYLSLRPGGHLKKDIVYEELQNLCDETVKSLESASWVIQISTRQGCYAISADSILYCQSDLKYVELVTEEGKRYRKLGKLNDLKKKLSKDFVRVHQSYIVNFTKVIKYDKSAKLLILSEGTHIPVSRAYIGSVLDQFQECQLEV